MIKDRDNKTIKRGGVFQYTNVKGETKVFVYDGEVEANECGTITVKCHYADNPHKIVPRQLRPDQIVRITRNTIMYKLFYKKYTKGLKK